MSCFWPMSNAKCLTVEAFFGYIGGQKDFLNA